MSQAATQKNSTPIPTMEVHLPPHISSIQVKMHSNTPGIKQLKHAMGTPTFVPTKVVLTTFVLITFVQTMSVLAIFDLATSVRATIVLAMFVLAIFVPAMLAQTYIVTYINLSLK